MAGPDTPPPAPRDLLDLSGRVAIVTGAGGGIGSGIAWRFAAAGAAVVLHHRTSAAAAETLRDELAAAGWRAVTAAGDLTRPDDVAAVVAAAVDAFGRLDVMVNSAGVQPLVGLLDMTAAQWDEVMEANVRSTFLCTQAAARVMIAQGDGGAIVNVASIEAENPAPLHSHYNASKAAVLMHTRAAALELGRHGIRVNCVSPGLIWREGLDEQWPEGVARWHAAAPLGRLGSPDDVGDACLFLASPGARWITGANLRVDGGVMTNQIW